MDTGTGDIRNPSTTTYPGVLGRLDILLSIWLVPGRDEAGRTEPRGGDMPLPALGATAG